MVFLGVSFEAHVVVRFDSNGSAQAQGVILVKDRPGITVLVAERSPTTASCADSDGDGVAGMTSLQFNVRNLRSGEVLPVTVVPERGDVDDRDKHPVNVRVGNSTYTGWSSFYRSF